MPPLNPSLSLPYPLLNHIRLYFCDLCFEHTKLFPLEQKIFTRKELALHRTGSRADFAGHPSCKFCTTQ